MKLKSVDAVQQKEAKWKRKRPKEEAEKAPEAKKKKRRPWRQAVRHRARREKKQMDEEEGGGALPEGQNYQEESVDGSTNSGAESESDQESNQQPKSDGIEQQKPNSKKRKLSRAKRLRRKNGKKTEQKDEEKEEEPSSFSQLDASRFRFLNEQLYSQSSSASAELFRADPAAFRAYHRGYKAQLAKWPVNPVDKLALDLATLPAGSVIADLGCGDAQLAKKLEGNKFKLLSFDLVAANERVTEADMANLPLDAGSVDVCVYCLSLMGTNLAQFLREAHRVLRMNGKMKIVEIASRFRSAPKFVAAMEKMGFRLKRKKELGDGFFIMFTMEKVSEKMANKRPLGLHLDPCLYKKR